MAKILSLKDEKRRIRDEQRRLRNLPTPIPAAKQFIHNGGAVIEASYQVVPPPGSDKRDGRVSLKLTNHASMQLAVLLKCGRGEARVENDFDSIEMTFTGPAEYEFLQQLVARMAVDLGVEHRRQEIARYDAGLAAVERAHIELEQDDEFDEIPAHI